MPTSTPIQTREQLQEYLHVATQLEHATVPPYLTALCSIRPDAKKTNFDAASIIRTVVVEEMLHLSLAANLLNAVGGRPDLNRKGFIPAFPTVLPTGQDDFHVGLMKFSKEAIDTFLQIERPATTPGPSDATVEMDGVHYVKHEHLVGIRATQKGLFPHVMVTNEQGEQVELHYHSIGEFYKAIVKGVQYLADQMGESELFTGDPAFQVGREHYYSGGGEAIRVTDLESAVAAIELISDQGEGHGGSIGEPSGELSHYYRFQQLSKEKFYQKGDATDHPTGEKLEIHWDQVHPILTNAKIANYPQGSAVRTEAVKFNREYKNLLARVNDALNGNPDLLIKATGEMRAIKHLAEQLMHIPVPGADGNAAPTFEIDDLD